MTSIAPISEAEGNNQWTSQQSHLLSDQLPQSLSVTHGGNSAWCLHAVHDCEKYIVWFSDRNSFTKEE